MAYEIQDVSGFGLTGDRSKITINLSTPMREELKLEIPIEGALTISRILGSVAREALIFKRF